MPFLPQVYTFLPTFIPEKSTHRHSSMKNSPTDAFLRRGGNSLILPFILVTSCFALWGFANDITNPLVDAFSRIFGMNVAQGALVQTAFYGGYFAMAFPAALFIRRYSYKAGVLLGLGLYAAGALLFFPAKMSGTFGMFLLAYFILTCGLSFLETSCNPYILSMGAPESATRRLNFAQCFNPIGSLFGMTIAMIFIQARLHPADTKERMQWNAATFEQIKNSDLDILIAPYLWIALVIVLLFFALLLVRMPANGERTGDAKTDSLKKTLTRLLHLKRYRNGVVAQFFYVGAQIMCWTFVIQYGKHLLLSDNSLLDSELMRVALRVVSLLEPDTYVAIIQQTHITEAHAAVLSQMVNIMAMVMFCLSRFACTYFLRFIPAGRLLAVLAVGAICLTGVVIFSRGINGLYALIGISACMSLMFPTIYGMALEGLDNDAKIGAAGLIMSILGGSILPFVQGLIIDQGDPHTGLLGALPAVNVSFVLPLLSFIVVALYGYKTQSHATV